MSLFRQELFATLANELNNNDWSFDGKHVVRAALGTNDELLHLAVSDGHSVLEHYTIQLRRKHEGPQTRRGKRPARIRSKKS